jgi:hypothetical protein
MLCHLFSSHIFIFALGSSECVGLSNRPSPLYFNILPGAVKAKHEQFLNFLKGLYFQEFFNVLLLYSLLIGKTYVLPKFIGKSGKLENGGPKW